MITIMMKVVVMLVMIVVKINRRQFFLYGMLGWLVCFFFNISAALYIEVI